VYNNPINNSDPTGHRPCDGEFGCSAEPQQKSKPTKPSTNTNKPQGGGNKPANRATRAEHTGGNDTPTGWSPDVGPLPSVFVGDPADVKAAWDLLEEAAAYGPRTRSHIEGMLKAIKIMQGYGQGMKIVLVNDNNGILVGSFDASAIDLGDIGQLPDNSLNPCAPPIAMLHEFTEQYEKQIAGKSDFFDAHYLAIDAENMANIERYGNEPLAPIRPRDFDRTSGWVGDNPTKVSILYNVAWPEIGGRQQAWVTRPNRFADFSVEVTWRVP
jgi:hypothetical protein